MWPISHYGVVSEYCHVLVFSIGWWVFFDPIKPAKFFLQLKVLFFVIRKNANTKIIPNYQTIGL
jgi:hypothetical protein